jgi:carboxylate-amine ligase
MRRWRPSSAMPDSSSRCSDSPRRIHAFGVHVQAGLRDRSNAVPIVIALAVYLPHFRPLTASGPLRGRHTAGLASGRAVIFGGPPAAAPPHLSADWSEFEEYMDTLLRAGTIRSIKEVSWDVRPRPGEVSHAGS